MSFHLKIQQNRFFYYEIGNKYEKFYLQKKIAFDVQYVYTHSLFIFIEYWDGFIKSFNIFNFVVSNNIINKIDFPKILCYFISNFKPVFVPSMKL